jgi:hypothetical protein
MLNIYRSFICPLASYVNRYDVGAGRSARFSIERVFSTLVLELVSDPSKADTPPSAGH